MSKESSFLYLPQGINSYKGNFSYTFMKVEQIAKHIISVYGNINIIIPISLKIEVLHPQNFVKLKEILTIDHFLLIDRVIFDGDIEGSLVHITDHRNISGKNPLTGETPIGDRPRFPDVSNIYEKGNIGLPQVVVSSVGPGRFQYLGKTHSDEVISEVAAWISLPATYAGIRVTAIGWNVDKDRDGKTLNVFISQKLKNLL